MHARILLIEDDAAFQAMIREALEGRGHGVACASRAEEGLALLAGGAFEIVLTDVRLPGMSGLEAVPRIKAAAPEADVIVMTAFSSRETAVEAVRLGASDFFAKPFSLGELEIVIRRALERRSLRGEVHRLREALRREGPARRIIGESPPMLELKALVERIAPLDTTVLITGESGTGKELVSDTIRALSSRASGPFIKINCAAIPEHLFENELFGHERGAFTGAGTAQPGKFELAHGGTILLDEIGDMPLAIQPKLLRAVEQKQVERLGARRPVDVDVRIVAATNQDLTERMADKRFREDLYYRLNVAAVHLPPLRRRKEDVPLLAGHFLRRIAATLGLGVERLSPGALALLAGHDWPGNVRQLANVLEGAAIRATGPELAEADVAAALGRGGPSPRAALCGPAPADGEGIDLRQAMRDAERGFLEDALRAARGRQTEAARLLGLTPKNLWAKLRKHGIDPKTLP
jgi:DNA-binding NtrC family response regulator